MLPVLSRELSVTARRRGTYFHRVFVAGLAGSIAFSFFLFTSSGSTGVGNLMFQVLSWSLFVLASLEGLRSTADALASERREGTLGLLFLTPMRAPQIVLGKLGAAAIRSGSALFAALPIFALTQLMGGVSIGEWWRTALALAAALGLGLGAGLLASAGTSITVTALGAAVALVLGVQLVPLVFVLLILELDFTSLWAAGPLGMLLTGGAALYKTDPSPFWKAVMVSSATMITLVAASGCLLARTWRRTDRAREAWWWRLVRPSGGHSEAWGGASGADDPAVWLAERTLPGRNALWILIGSSSVAGFLGGAFGGDFVWVYLSIALLIKGFLLKGWAAAIAPQSIHLAHRSGALELILCTPLSSGRILRGQLDALEGYLFAPVLTAAMTIPISMLFGATITNNSPAMAALMIVFPASFLWLMTFMLDMHALARLGLWLGLTEVKPESAVAKNAGAVLLLPLATLIIPILGVLGLLLWPWFWMSWASRRLDQDFRDAAAGLLKPVQQ